MTTEDPVPRWIARVAALALVLSCVLGCAPMTTPQDSGPSEPPPSELDAGVLPPADAHALPPDAASMSVDGGPLDAALDAGFIDQGLLQGDAVIQYLGAAGPDGSMVPTPGESITLHYVLRSRADRSAEWRVHAWVDAERATEGWTAVVTTPLSTLDAGAAVAFDVEVAVPETASSGPVLVAAAPFVAGTEFVGDVQRLDVGVASPVPDPDTTLRPLHANVLDVPRESSRAARWSVALPEIGTVQLSVELGDPAGWTAEIVGTTPPSSTGTLTVNDDVWGLERDLDVRFYAAAGAEDTFAVLTMSRETEGEIEQRSSALFLEATAP